MSDVVGTLYIAHIEPPYRHAQHYIGWTEGEPDVRWNRHLTGNGSPLIRAAIAAGLHVAFYVLGAGTRRDERKLHQTNRGSRHCPACRDKVAQ